MREKFTTLNGPDFRQRYNETYGFFIKDSGEKILVQVFVGNKHLTFVNSEGFEYRINPDTPNEFEFIPVSRGWYDIGENIHFLTRRPERQWRRGICVDNTSAFYVRNGRMFRFDLDTQTLEKILQHAVDHKTSVASYEKQGHAALSKNFAIVANKVWFESIPVGTIKKNNIMLSNDLILQELTDLIKRNNYPFTVSL